MKYQCLMMTNFRGQSIIQYMAIMGIVTAALVTMGPGIKRTIQAAYKNVTDQIAPQAGVTADPKKGYVDLAVTQGGTLSKTIRTENNGDIILEYEEKNNTPFTQTNSHYGNPPSD